MKVVRTPGSLYKRFAFTNMQKMNRSAVENYSSAFRSGGMRMFEATASASIGRSELVAKQVIKRIQSEAQAKIANYRLGKLANRSV